MTLDLEDIEAIAQRVAQLLGSVTSDDGFIDARDAARRLGVRRGWVYAHARELGGVRLGNGDRAPLRFPPAAIHAWVERLQREARPAPPATSVPGQPERRSAVQAQADAELALIPGRTSRARHRSA